MADQLANAAANTLARTPDQASAATLNTLNNAYLAAKEKEAAAPGVVRDAEKAYYTALEGSDGYATRLSDRNASQGAQLQTQLTAAHASDIAQVDAAIATYASTASYATNVESVVLGQLNEIIAMSDAVRSGADSQNTNNRKSAFLDMQRSTVTKWDTHLTIGIWVLALLYAKRNVDQLSNPIPWVVFATLVASPWIFSMLGWLVGRSIPPFNVYTTFSAS